MKYVTFWSRYSSETDTSIDLWKSREIELSELGRLTLFSHEKLKNEVILYTYQKIKTKLPSNVMMLDARMIFDTELAYDCLNRGQRICHVSDLIRLTHTARYTGVIIDLDTVVLRRFPDHGFIGSMPAKMTGGFAPQWGNAHPPLNIINNSWDGRALIDFPVSVDEQMRYNIDTIAETMYTMLQGKPIEGFKGWNAICKGLEKIPARILPPFYTCPVPPWRGKNKCYSLESPTRFDGETTLFGHRMPKIDEILEGSLAVQHFFESSFRGEYRSEKGFWDTIEDDCLLAREAEYILGKDWRKVLNESDNVLEQSS